MGETAQTDASMEATIMNQALKTIVLGTSLTGDSDGVVATGVAIARATGASVWLLHADTPYPPFPPPLSSDVAVNYAQLMEHHVGEVREALGQQAQRTGLAALAGFAPDQVRVTLGAPHRELVDLARRVQADLIVVGAAEAGRGALGSTAERVIRKAPCPVLVVRAGAAFPPRRVEIPADLSAISASALRQGLALLAPFGVEGREIEVLFVLSPFEVGGSIHFEPEQIQRFAEEELRRFVAANTTHESRPGSTRVVRGYARTEILAAISERGADLAVIGTHGRSGFERLVLGSVAAGVLREARCNLLVVPPEAGLQREVGIESLEERTGGDWNYVSDETTAAKELRARPPLHG